MEMKRTSMFRSSPIDLSPSNSGFPRTDLNAKFKEMNDACGKLTAYFGEVDKSNIDKLNESATVAQAALFANDCALLKKQVEADEAQITAYQLKNLDTPPSATDVTPSTDPKAPNEADYWTSIIVEVSSSYSAEQTSSSSNSFLVGGGASWRLWSVGGNASHLDATADAAKQVGNSSIKASFDCMRVDITRS